MIDPIIGLLITAAILVIVRDTIVKMWFRMMDAVALRRRQADAMASVRGKAYEIDERQAGDRLQPADRHPGTRQGPQLGRPQQLVVKRRTPAHRAATGSP